MTYMFRNISIAMLLCMTSFSVMAQTGDLQKEINDQVWKPFIKSFNERDNATFRSVHSKDVVRVEQDSKRIFGYDQYFRELPDSIQAKRAVWKNNIELRFIQRIAAGDKAFEVGYYKSQSKNSATGEIRTGYGKFHVLLRKENGVWKIMMDADTGENMNETVFLSGQAIE